LQRVAIRRRRWQREARLYALGHWRPPSTGETTVHITHIQMKYKNCLFLLRTLIWIILPFMP
jgi:hypothetical protein